MTANALLVYLRNCILFQFSVNISRYCTMLKQKKRCRFKVFQCSSSLNDKSAFPLSPKVQLGFLLVQNLMAKKIGDQTSFMFVLPILNERKCYF
ncbi:hypothetical protein FKM82_004638 [Ascaphus truei]